jgi:hypothetical protein
MMFECLGFSEQALESAVDVVLADVRRRKSLSMPSKPEAAGKTEAIKPKIELIEKKTHLRHEEHRRGFCPVCTGVQLEYERPRAAATSSMPKELCVDSTWVTLRKRAARATANYGRDIFRWHLGRKFRK